MDSDFDPFVDGKPLSQLRVVDLKQELKKRGVRPDGNKAVLQILLRHELSKELTKQGAQQMTPNETLVTEVDNNNIQLQQQQTIVNAVEEQPTDLSGQSFANVSQISADSYVTAIDMSQDLKGNNEIETKQIEVKRVTAELNDENSSQSKDSVNTEIDDESDNSESKPLNAAEMASETNDSVVIPSKYANESKADDNSGVQSEVVYAMDLTREVNDDSIGVKSESINQTETNQEVSEESNDLVSNETKQEVDDDYNGSHARIGAADMKREANEDNDERQSKEMTRQISEDNDEEQSKEMTREISEDNDEQSMEISREVNEDNDEVRSKELNREGNDGKRNRLNSGGEGKARPPRKRRWGSTVSANTNTELHNTYKGISSDQLKDLMPDFNYSNNSNATEKVSKFETGLTVSPNIIKTQTAPPSFEPPLKRDIRVVRKSVSVPEEETTSDSRPDDSSQYTTLNTETKKAQVVSNESEPPVADSVSPPRNPQSNILFIKNLVRPFTLLNLKDLLGKTGKLFEDKFWIDKIKSKCFVTYANVDEAVATRDALHGKRWPDSNPKQLDVDFATEDDLDYHLNAEKRVNNDLTNNKKPEDSTPNEKTELTKSDSNTKLNANADKELMKNRPIREWDREKLSNDNERSRNAKNRRYRSPSPKGRNQEEMKRRRHDSTKGGEHSRPNDAKVEPISGPHGTESPAKLLDDLFKKTTASPCIYWLPLTDEQIVAREAQRAENARKRKEEAEAREEQMRKRREASQERREKANELPNKNERDVRRRSVSPVRRRSPSPNRRNMQRRRSPPRRSPPRSPHRRTSFSRSPVNRRSPPRRRR